VNLVHVEFMVFLGVVLNDPLLHGPLGGDDGRRIVVVEDRFCLARAYLGDEELCGWFSLNRKTRVADTGAWLSPPKRRWLVLKRVNAPTLSSAADCFSSAVSLKTMLKMGRRGHSRLGVRC